MKHEQGYPIGQDLEARLEETKRLTRILQLVSMICYAPRRWTRRSLSTHFEISERQLDNDFAQIRHGLRCELAHTRQGYYFKRLPELPPVRYTTPEALALITALQFAWDSGALDDVSLAAALARTEAALPESFLPLMRSLRRSVGAVSHQQQHRAGMLAAVQNALKDLRCLRVVYETASRGGERNERVWQPYYLVFRDQKWLVTAYDNLRNEVRDFTIDRVVEATLLEEQYTIPADFDATAYRGTAWGVLRGMGGETQHIILRLTAEEGRRLRDDKHHASQREERQPDGTWLVTYDVGITPELVRWVFRWGAGCEVLEPPKLREMVVALARAVAGTNE